MVSLAAKKAAKPAAKKAAPAAKKAAQPAVKKVKKGSTTRELLEKMQLQIQSSTSQS